MIKYPRIFALGWHPPHPPTGHLARGGRVCWMGAAVLIACACSNSSAQGTHADYERSAGWAAATRDKLRRTDVQPHWIEQGPQFWYQVKTAPDGVEYVFVDPERGVRQLLFDPPRLAAALATASDRKLTADNLSLRQIEVTRDRSAISFVAFQRRWTCPLDTYLVAPLESSGDGSATTDGGGLPSLPGIQTTQRTGDETQLEFYNSSPKAISLFWIDAQGGRRGYGELGPGEHRKQHTFAGHAWLATNQDQLPLLCVVAPPFPATVVIDGTPHLRERPGGARRSRSRAGRSPDGKWQARIENHNLQLRNPDTGDVLALTSDGSEEDAYQRRFSWSPDSRYLLAYRRKKGQGREVHVIESAPRDQLQPKVHAFGYDKPGDDLPLDRLVLCDLADQEVITISDQQMPHAWSLGDLTWRGDSSSFTLFYNQRGHQRLCVFEVAAETGEAEIVVDEQSETFIDYAGKHFSHYLDATREMLWMSERDGWNHLYLYDVDLRELKQQVTRGPWVVRGVERVDEPQRQIWFRAGGVYPDQDPYHVHLCRVNFDGTGFVILTEGDGTHQWQFSPDGTYLIDTWSRVDQAPVTQLRSAQDGRLVCALETADWSSLLATGWRPPERFVTPGRDATTPIYGIIVRPSQWEKGRRYPVIEKIYAGPQSAFVPKAFGVQRELVELAELGFVVVQIDGMGTSHRSKAFHDVCWKNLGDSGFPDRIKWITAAAEQYPEMDLARVGIYGGSAGGQSALRAVLAHGDFYHAAAADCGCHDNRMDKVWWNELWMGWPVGPHYVEQSNVTQAHRLEGKLLLMVGAQDRNVDPASTMQVVDALIQADKDFELIVFPRSGHGAGSSPYGRRRQNDFFVRHLWNAEPRR